MAISPTSFELSHVRERAGTEVWKKDRAVLALLALVSVAATLAFKVNPWPRDGWYESQYFLFGSFPGHDNLIPIAAPAFLYRGAHLIAQVLGFGLAGEFYVASILQNLMVLLGACFLYYTLKLVRMNALAAPFALGYLLFVLSLGLAQAFYSENAALFLTSALLLALVAVRGDDSNTKFWTLAIICGLLIGLLVVTRMTPVFFIPAIALLFFRRMPLRRVAQFTGTLLLITALIVAGTMSANHARFGRYELVNSTGRHLWNGVTPFADAALAHSADYQRLRQIKPRIQGLQWYEIPPANGARGHYKLADPREPLLEKLSKEAIANAPGRFLLEGGKKLVTTIGDAPYRLGYGRADGHWNPLERTELLPAPATPIVGAWYGHVADAGFRRLYELFRWFYPITIFAIALTGLAFLAQYMSRRLGRSSAARRKAPLAVFLVLGLPLIALPILASAGKRGSVFASLVCVALLAAGAAALHITLRPSDSTPYKPPALRLSYLGFLALMFFGTMWFSWQVEVANSRNAIPYLPLLATMLAITVSYWKTQPATSAGR